MSNLAYEDLECELCHKTIRKGEYYECLPHDTDSEYLIEHKLCGMRKDAKTVLNCEVCGLPICWVADILEHKEDCDLIPLCFNCKPTT